MPELIDRSSIPNYKIWGMATVGGLKQPAEMRIVMWDDLMRMPVVTPESLVKHGRWLDGRCTACGWEEPDGCYYDGYEDESWEETPYCPSCGARMDLEEQTGV